ncbi:MAG: MerR family transcriptional regulator [Lachnospiraceae bacterium]|nr:MerR family transcriptional regulator [Lachnospiraceae bacterium]MBR4058471.1 MerR family transcriptional regulator [Lachnospiraceae bacterium]
MIQQMYTIKEAAKELGVEAHALRYWEEELGLTIERNAQGRRVYSEEDMQMFKDIMAWKEQGLQLKSIKEMLHGKVTDKELSGSRDELAGHRIIVYRPKEMNGLEDTSSREKEEKARRLQELLKQFISESIRESNEELLQAMKEGLLKELDYQFRLQEEREEEREKVRIEMEDAHFKKLDENLRSAMEKRGRKKKRVFGK